MKEEMRERAGKAESAGTEREAGGGRTKKRG